MPTKKKPAAPSGGRRMAATGKVPVQVWLAAADHARLRVAAAKCGLPMTAFVRGAVFRRIGEWEEEK